MQSMAVLWFVCLFLPQLLFLIARTCMDDSKIKKNRSRNKGCLYQNFEVDTVECDGYLSW